MRSRQEDLPALARELLTPETLKGLTRAAWPGNVRELRNYLERSLVFQEAQPLGEAAPGPSTQAPVAVDPTLTYSEARQRALDAFEQSYVRALIEHHGGKVAAAATAAGTGRVYLYKLARRHGIKPS